MAYNVVEALEQLFTFEGRTLTLVSNLSQRWGVPLSKVKQLYIQSRAEYLINTKKLKINDQMELKLELAKLTNDDYRQMWFDLTSLVRFTASGMGGATKRKITILQNKTIAILKRDATKLKSRATRLKNKLPDMTKEEANIAKSLISKYAEFLERVKSDRCVAHFMNKLIQDPKLESFLFKV